MLDEDELDFEKGWEQPDPKTTRERENSIIFVVLMVDYYISKFGKPDYFNQYLTSKNRARYPNRSLVRDMAFSKHISRFELEER